MKEWIVFGLSSCVIQWNDVQVASYRKINKSVTQNRSKHRLKESKFLTCYISIKGHEWCWGLDDLSIDLIGTNTEISDPLIRFGHLWCSILVFGSFKSPRIFQLSLWERNQTTLNENIFRRNDTIALIHSRTMAGAYCRIHITQLTRFENTHKMTAWLPRNLNLNVSLQPKKKRM